jgi:hypothetical protein
MIPDKVKIIEFQVSDFSAILSGLYSYLEKLIVRVVDLELP